MMTGFEAAESRIGQSAGSDQPNLAVEQTAGSHALAAAAHRGVRLRENCRQTVTHLPGDKKETWATGSGMIDKTFALVVALPLGVFRPSNSSST